MNFWNFKSSEEIVRIKTAILTRTCVNTLGTERDIIKSAILQGVEKL